MTTRLFLGGLHDGHDNNHDDNCDSGADNETHFHVFPPKKNGSGPSNEVDKAGRIPHVLEMSLA